MLCSIGIKLVIIIKKNLSIVGDISSVRSVSIASNSSVSSLCNRKKM